MCQDGLHFRFIGCNKLIMRRFFIEPAAAECHTVCLSEADAKHIRTVLRLKPGTRVILFDAAGREYTAALTDVTKEHVFAAILDGRSCAAESSVHITIAQGFLKEKKMDTLVRALTELGMNRWIPYLSARSVPRPTGQRLDNRTERWQKIIRESLKQCRRSVAPDIFPVTSFEEVIALSASSALKIAFWEKAVDPIPVLTGNRQREDLKSVFVLLGPEGGFSESEIDIATGAGFITATLGPRILRAETASLVACGLVQYIFGDLGTASRL